jgi:type I restriction enzyme M protein
MVARDKASLDIFWLNDESLQDSENLPEPGVIAAEIVEDLESALEQMRLIARDWGRIKGVKSPLRIPSKKYRCEYRCEL